MRGPTFLIIGAAKAGTSAMHDCLGRHPSIFVSQIKEPHYFSFCLAPPDPPAPGLPTVLTKTYVVESEEVYLNLFRDSAGCVAVGESSVSYLYWPGTADRIHRFNPAMKIIVSLRNPVDRAYSNFNYLKGWGIEDAPDVIEGIAREEVRRKKGYRFLFYYRALGLYTRQLEEYLRVFPRDSIKIILYEDLLPPKRERTYRELFRFLGVDESESVDLSHEANVTLLPDTTKRWHQLFTTDNWVRRAARGVLPFRMSYRLAYRLKRRFFKRPPPMSPELRDRLLVYFRDDIEQLEEVIDRDLSHWLKVDRRESTQEAADCGGASGCAEPDDDTSGVFWPRCW